MNEARAGNRQASVQPVVVRPDFAPRQASVEVSPAERLLAVEAEIRELGQLSELQFHLVNETRRFVSYRQAFLITTPATARVMAVSSLAAPDRNSPNVRWIETLARRLAAAEDTSAPVEFSLPAYGDHDARESAEYPFPEFLWVPLKDVKGDVFAGVLLTSERPWRRASVTLAERLAATYAHAWLALAGRRRMPTRRHSWLRRLWPLAAAGVVAAGFVPVPMTTLAPAEIVARDPAVITAPMRGVIESVEVEPNSQVKPGDVLFRFDDTELRNELEVAEKALLVAAATRQQTKQSSLIDARSKRDLAVAQAEYTLKQAERDYVHDRLAQTEVRAPAAGLAIFPDPDEWVGRPVSTGERIMSVADPARVKVQVELAVEDAIALENGAKIRLYLDADPLNPVPARVEHASYHAEALPGGRLAYRIDAGLEGVSAARIGLRGTAQMFGDDVPLYFFLFRRPIAAVRQSLGI